MAAVPVPRRSPAAYFVLVLLLTVPFLALSALSSSQLLPGLPPAALAVVCPVTAALILEHRRGGRAAAGALLRRSYDFARIRAKGWYVPVLLLHPAVLAVSYLYLRLRGIDVPAIEVSAPALAAMVAVFLVSAVCEELGWSAYAVESLTERWGALGAALIVGAAWAVWHWPALLQAHRPPGWIAWWTLGTLAMRVIMVWLFVNTGMSVFAVALFHMVSNLGWQVFPVHGSYYDEPSVAVVMAVAAVVIVAVWGPRALRRR
ncbi:CPBP family intramembrane metalloprotease [Nonomuraea sp. FMUSA5-5]|uniref:CPBP family intramembrane metalloprotease n=1 Tax=Nonomuraea composti TaxID=2720023 RepID=A0ABX1AST6_9ACTN|nr:CPBP family intramembrane glutamic endopeptidase [Nonomuraea sp. FMUSA5-5]NJP88705.1 CPBP family intramembrane metalloprotease [Nonomuraea sp. FMUSA5-5]